MWKTVKKVASKTPGAKAVKSLLPFKKKRKTHRSGAVDNLIDLF